MGDKVLTKTDGEDVKILLAGDNNEKVAMDPACCCGCDEPWQTIEIRMDMSISKSCEGLSSLASSFFIDNVYTRIPDPNGETGDDEFAVSDNCLIKGPNDNLGQDNRAFFQLSKTDPLACGSLDSFATISTQIQQYAGGFIFTIFNGATNQVVINCDGFCSFDTGSISTFDQVDWAGELGTYSATRTTSEWEITLTLTVS